MRADEELVSCKEVLAKVETERGALQVKLKHARNQVDVEIRRRQKAEAVHEKLVGIRANFLECMKKCDVFLTHGFVLCYVDEKKERQLQLIRDLLISDGNGNSVHLSEEQRSALAFLSSHSQAAQAAKNNPNSSQRSAPKHTITQEDHRTEDK